MKINFTVTSEVLVEKRQAFERTVVPMSFIVLSLLTTNKAAKGSVLLVGIKDGIYFGERSCTQKAIIREMVISPGNVQFGKSLCRDVKLHLLAESICGGGGGHGMIR
jgi:hypothetical protein